MAGFQIAKRLTARVTVYEFSKLILIYNRCGYLGFDWGHRSLQIHSRSRIQAFLKEQKCDDVPCSHRFVRFMAIESVISQRGSAKSYLMIGDSITELADLPTICGHLPINAGIGWATVATFLTEGHRLAELSKPDFIVLALGTNDAFNGQENGFRERFEALLKSLQPWKTLIVPLPPGKKVPNTQKLNSELAALKVPQAARMDYADTIDGVHLAASSYVEWKRNIVEAAKVSVCD